MDITLVKSTNGTINGAIFYTYNPSQPAAYAYMALFALVTLAHLIYMFPLRSWYFTNFILGGICETFGYYGRSRSHDNTGDVGPWILQNVMILGAPTFFAATVYMTLARLTVALGAERYSMIRPNWLTKIYVCIDILCFFSQFLGAGVQASGDPTVISIGNKAILGGLVFQLVAFSFFVFMARRIETCFGQQENRTENERSGPVPGWRRHFWMLYSISILFIARNLMRAIEYGQVATGGGGFTYITRLDDGTLQYEGERKSRIGDVEWVLYVFDASLMFLVALGFLVLHPARLIREPGRGKGKRLLSGSGGDGQVEMEEGIGMKR